MRNLLIAISAFMLGATAAQAYPGLTVEPTTMRASTSPKSRVIQRIPANAEIDISNCTSKWCYASWRNAFGYIPASDVEPEAPQPRPLYGPPPVVVAPYWGPYWGRGWGPGYYGGGRRLGRRW